MKTRFRIPKQILSVLLCLVMLMSYVPAFLLTASAADTSVPGAQGHALTELFTGTFSSGSDATIIVYVTPGAADTMQYQVYDDRGFFQIPYYDSTKWYFDGWRTWYKGSQLGAGIIQYDEANPEGSYFDVDENGFITDGTIDWSPGSMIVSKDYFWAGTYYLSAIFKPIVTVNAGNGASYEFSSVDNNTVNENNYGVKYQNTAFVSFTVDNAHILQGIEVSGTTYTVSDGSVSLDAIIRPTSVTINTRLKQQKVFFNANGGEGTMDAQIYEHGAEQALTANRFTHGDYTFTGWNTKADGSGTAYTNIQSVSFSPANDGDSITLYAQWTECIGHNWVDGVCTECDAVCSHSGGNATCKEQAICDICGEKHGMIDLFGHSYDETTHICAYCGETEKFMATWCNGNGDSYEKEFAFGEVITIPSNEYFEDTFRNSGYMLTGWDGYTEGMTMPAAPVTFTAVYAPADYTVSFDTNGGAAIDPISVTYNNKYGRLPSSSVTGLSGGDRNWYLVDKNGNVTDTTITQFSNVEQTRDHTLFVKRKVLAPNVSLSLSVPGGISDSYSYYIPGNSTRILTATVKNQNSEILDYTYQWYKDGTLLEGENGATLTLPGNVSDAGNYKVVVTATLKDGTGIVVTEDAASGEKEMKVKILHVANELKYDANGGEGGPSANYTGGTTATVSTDKPNREHYVFMGWNTKADGTGDTYAAGATYTFENDGGNGGCVTTLYAQWKPETKTVTYTVNGEVYKTDLVEYGKDAALPEVPTKEGHSGTWDHDGKNITADTKINAVYTINEYKVSFNADDTEIGNETVKHGNDATLPEIPKKDGYIGKWDAEGKNITADTVISVIYTEIANAVPNQVKPEDKNDLEDTKKQLEDMLNDDSYTEGDKKVIQDAIDSINDALEVIENVEAVEELINNIPENITKNDEDAIKAADEAYNALTDYEKSLVDEEAKETLDDAKTALAELNKPADPNSPQTGDNSNLWLWFALLFVSGTGIFAITVYDRKRKAASKR